MAEPKITVTWTDNNADETGHKIFASPDPWGQGASTEIKAVAADVTSADLTLAEVPTSVAFLQVAAVRGADQKKSKEYAMAVKTPVVEGDAYVAAYSNLAELPYGAEFPTVTKGANATYTLTPDGNGLDLTQGFTVTPDGLLLQVHGQRIRTLNPATGAQANIPFATGISQIGSAICMAHDGNAYLVGREAGNVTLYRYNMDEEAPVAVYSWPYGSGPGSEINPANIKQGGDGRLYLFGGYNGFTATQMVVNSINIDGTDPRTDALTIPAGWNVANDRVLYTPNDRIVVWQPGSDSILCYDPNAAGGPAVEVFTGNVALNTGTDLNASSRRSLVAYGQYGVLIAGNGVNICNFMYENNAQAHVILPSEFVTDHPVRELYESIMGWLFVSNVQGDLHICRTDGSGQGSVTHLAATTGMENTFNGHTFARVGKTVYMMADDSTDLHICPFTIGSIWQSTGPFDAASLANTSARGQNG